MQFPGKLINQLKKKQKNLILVPIFGFLDLWVLPLLNVIHCWKLSLYAVTRKSNEPNLWKQQKTLFRAWPWPLWHKFGPQKFSLWILPLLDVRHYCKLLFMQFAGKLMNHNWQNGKKTSLGPDFGQFNQISGSQRFF